MLESFQHSDGAGSSAIYNYKWDDDWGTDSAGNIKHNVTYGKEVSDTIKNRVDNVSRQNKYHGDWSKDDRYTSPVKITQQRNIALLNTSHMLLNRMIPPKTMMR